MLIKVVDEEAAHTHTHRIQKTIKIINVYLVQSNNEVLFHVMLKLINTHTFMFKWNKVIIIKIDSFILLPFILSFFALISILSSIAFQIIFNIFSSIKYLIEHCDKTKKNETLHSIKFILWFFKFNAPVAIFLWLYR